MISPKKALITGIMSAKLIINKQYTKLVSNNTITIFYIDLITGQFT